MSVLHILYYLLHEFWYFLLLTLIVLHLLKRIKLRDKILTFLSAFMFLFVLLPVPQWIAIRLENQYPQRADLPQDIKGIIILGGSHDDVISQARGRPSYNYAAGRLLDSLVLLQKYPHIPVIYAGGGENALSGFSEARTFKEYLVQLGIPLDRFLFEEKSTNTKENADNCAKILRPSREDRYALVTSAIHMPRAAGLFRKAGFNIVPVPVDYKTTGSYDIRSSFVLWRASLLLRAVTHECLALLRHKIKGELA